MPEERTLISHGKDGHSANLSKTSKSDHVPNPMGEHGLRMT